MLRHSAAARSRLVGRWESPDGCGSPRQRHGETKDWLDYADGEAQLTDMMPLCHSTTGCAFTAPRTSPPNDQRPAGDRSQPLGASDDEQVISFRAQPDAGLTYRLEATRSASVGLGRRAQGHSG